MVLVAEIQNKIALCVPKLNAHRLLETKLREVLPVKALHRSIDYFNRLRDCPERGSYNPGLGSGVHCSP